MLSVFKPPVERSLQPLAQLLRHVSPNVISLLGLIFPVLFFVFVLQQWYWWALLVFVFNGADLLDGMVARATGKVTPFGGFLDSTIDRFADFTVIAAFGFAHIVSWNIIMPLILLTYLISYIRSRTELAANNTLVASVGLIERTERLLLIFVGLLAYVIFPHVTLWSQNILELVCLVLIVLSVITVGQRVAFAYKKL